MKNTKKVYMYDLEGNLIKVFETTNDCGEFFGCDNDYINHNLKYCKKKRYKDTWVILSRTQK